MLTHVCARAPEVFYTFWLPKFASRYSGVRFFPILTSKSGPRMLCFAHFVLKMCFSLLPRAIFPHRNFKKWSEPGMFCTFWFENVLLATAACNFSCLLSIATFAPAALSRLLFDPGRHINHWKLQHFATSLRFCACISSFYWLSCHYIFFLLILLVVSAFSIFWLCFPVLLF